MVDDIPTTDALSSPNGLLVGTNAFQRGEPVLPEPDSRPKHPEICTPLMYRDAPSSLGEGRAEEQTR